MDTNRLHFDTLDLLVASVAIVTTLWLLPADAGHGTERFSVGVAVIGLVGAKRFVWPTPPANEDAPALLRMAYLFIALVGTARRADPGRRLLSRGEPTIAELRPAPTKRAVGSSATREVDLRRCQPSLSRLRSDASTRRGS